MPKINDFLKTPMGFFPIHYFSPVKLTLKDNNNRPLTPFFGRNRLVKIFKQLKPHHEQNGAMRNRTPDRIFIPILN